MDAPRPQTLFIISLDPNEIIPIQINDPNANFQSIIDVLRAIDKHTNIIYYSGSQALLVDPTRKISDYLPLRQSMISFWITKTKDLSRFPIYTIESNQILIFLLDLNFRLISLIVNGQTELNHIRSNLIRDYQLDVSIIKFSGDQQEKLEMGKISRHLPARTDQILFFLENISVGEHNKYISYPNQKSIQGWEIGRYRSSDLIYYKEKGQTYRFLKSDVSFLQQGLNPFTGRKIRPGPLKEFIRLAKEKKLFDPYGVVLPEDIKTKCPLFVSDDPLVKYRYNCEGNRGIISKSISSGQPTDYKCVGLIYQITLKSPLSQKDIDKNGIIRIDTSNIIKNELILDVKSLEVDRPPANRVLKETIDKTYPIYNQQDHITRHLSLWDALTYFMRYGGVILPNQAITDIVSQKIRLLKPIILYRGLTWFDTGTTFEKWMNQIGREKISIDDELDITSTRVASWSTNICVSSSFAATGNYGIVFSYQTIPEEIMLDTRMMSGRAYFYNRDQAEVMLLPGRKKNGEWGGPITRRVKVEMVVWNTGQRTPSGFLLKERPVNQYNLWVKELIIP